MHEHIRLTSGEIALLWNKYMNDAAQLCLLTHFQETCENPDIHELLKQARQLMQHQLQSVAAIFTEEGIAVPHAFSVEQDVIADAKKLFSDTFCLAYLTHLSKFSLATYAAALPLAARQDIYAFLREAMLQAEQLYHSAKEHMQRLGIFIRAPYIPYPEQAEFARHGFMHGWFSPRRPLLAEEIAHLYLNVTNNVIGRSMTIAFSQVVRDSEIRRYFLKGIKLCTYIVDHIHDMLEESHLPTPMSWDAEVLDSTEAPFSDKLMLFLISGLTTMGMSNYGGSLALSMRHDIVALYMAFLSKAGLYGEQGAGLMLDRGWFETPPHAQDREKLAARPKE